MALEISGEEFEDIRDVFFGLDENVNGYLTCEEIKSFFVDSPTEMTNFCIRALQIEDNTQVEFLDFLEMYSLLIGKKGGSKAQINKMFRGLDENNDGFLSVDEVIHFCQWFFPQDTHGKNYADSMSVEDLIKSLDTNGDGRIEYQEFVDNFSSF